MNLSSAPLPAYLIQHKEAHDREQARHGANPLPSYILQQLSPSTMVHNFLMEMDSYVTLKDWHSHFCRSPNFMNVRVGIIQTVYYLIRQRNPNPQPEWLQVLPNVAKQVELRLYYMAESLEEYQNTGTVKERIQVLLDGILRSNIYDSNSLIKNISTAERPVPVEDEHRKNSIMTGVSSMASFPIVSPTAVSSQHPYMIGQDSSPSGNVSANQPITDSRTLPVSKTASTAPLEKSLFSKGIMNFDDSNERVIRSHTTESLRESDGAITKQLSSQGCSRAFIVKVLLYMADFTKDKFLPSIFTFKKDLIQEWLTSAKVDCAKDRNFQKMEDYYGGPAFDIANERSHWQEPMHLLTWWKNSIERRSKYDVILQNATYVGNDSKKLQKGRFSQTLVLLVHIIRKNAEAFATAGACGVHKQQYLSDCTDDDHTEEFFYVNLQCQTPPNHIMNSMKVLNEIIEDIRNMREVKSLYVQACIDRKNIVKPAKSNVEKMKVPSKLLEDNIDLSEFPLKLYDIISDDSIDTICWKDGSGGFEIKRQNAFVSSVLTKYFDIDNYSLFLRRMNLYGIRRSPSGERGCYFHTHMQRGDRDSCRKISRVITSNLTDDELIEISRTFDEVVEPTKRYRFRIFHVDDSGSENDDADLNTLLIDYGKNEIEQSLHSQLCTLRDKLRETEKSDHERPSKVPRIDDSHTDASNVYMAANSNGAKAINIGDAYQAIIPDEIPEMNRSLPKPQALDAKMWCPVVEAQSKTVDIILKRIKERDIDAVLSPGMILLACVDKHAPKCTLVTIISLDRSVGQENAESRKVTVFDGIETHKITAGDMVLYSSGFSDLIHKAIHKVGKLNHESFQSLQPQAQSVVCDKVESIAFKSYFGARKSGQVMYNDIGAFMGWKLAKYSENVSRDDTYKEWSYLDVKLFCEGMKKFGGDLRKIWFALDRRRTMKDIIDFYYRIYPYGRDGGAQKLLRIYEARDAALKGIGDGDSSTPEENRNLIFKLMKLEKKYEDIESSITGRGGNQACLLPHCPTDA